MTELEKLRRRLRLSPLEMAESLDVTRDYYYTIESGRKPLSAGLALYIVDQWPGTQLNALLRSGRQKW